MGLQTLNLSLKVHSKLDEIHCMGVEYSAEISLKKYESS